MANRPEKPVLHTKKHIARLERERKQTRIILFTFIGILVVTVGLIVYGAVIFPYVQQHSPVAKVGSTNIPVSEWQARVRLERTQLINQIQIYQQYSAYFGMDFSSQIQQYESQLNDTSTLGETVLNQMIDEELVRQEAKKRGITASPEEVQRAIEASFNYYPNGTPTPTITPPPVSTPTLSPDTLAIITLTPTPGPETPTPTATHTPATSPTTSPTATGSAAASGSPAATGSPTATQPPTATPTETATATPEFTATPAATETPLPTPTPYTQQGFDTAYKNQLTKYDQMGLTEAQVRQLYETTILRQKLMDIVTANEPHAREEVWARHILVADQATAEKVRQQLVAGGDFAKLAAQYSTDTSNKDKGGDLGWFPKGQMVPEFEAVAFKLKVGEISQPVKTTYGYHIIQVLAHADIPLDAATYQQAKESAFSKWLTGLRDQYKVEIYNNWQNLVPTDPAEPAAPQ